MFVTDLAYDALNAFFPIYFLFLCFCGVLRTRSGHGRGPRCGMEEAKPRVTGRCRCAHDHQCTPRVRTCARTDACTPFPTGTHLLIHTYPRAHTYVHLEVGAPLLKSWGHMGVSVTHYAFDRAAYESLVPLLHCRHRAWHAGSESSEVTVPLGVEPELLDWVVTTACAAHDCSNALKWALQPEKVQPDLAKDLFKVVRSLRDHSTALHGVVEEFVLRYAKQAPNPDAMADAQPWWSALGLEPRWVETLSACNLVWHGDTLWTSLPVATEPTAREEVGACLHHLLRFHVFTETRWCAVGVSCRALVAALSVGLAEMVKLLRERDQSNEWYLTGWDKLSEHVRRYACVATVASYVPEGLLLELAEDDRVLRRMEVLEQTVKDELDFVQKLPDPFWMRLSYVYRSALHTPDVRTACLTGAQVAACFITRRVFAAARRAPFSLCHGDIIENVRALFAEAQEPKHPVMRKIWMLGQRGCGGN